MVNYKGRDAINPALDAVFGALADPTRRAIIARLAQGPSSVGELAAPLPMSPLAVLKHLKVLEWAGLLERERDGRIHRCRLKPGGMGEAEEWIQRTRAFWDERLESLGRYFENEMRGDDDE
jgi:DNA-binding transcriptional ArsR family regulator